MIAKLIVATGALAVLSFVASPGIASAGEVTGSGKPTPIADYNANSICSFSGLEDDDGGPNGGPGVTPQTWGQGLRAFLEEEDLTMREAIGLFGNAGVPGIECNGSTAGIK